MTAEGQDMTATVSQLSPRGIFDCDDAYKTPLREDYEHLFDSGIVVLDTNVLLNLYRSNERTRRDTLLVLSRLRDRLWIPHQVLSEFWRNRDLPSVRGHHRTKARDTCAALDKAHRSMGDALDRWLRDVHLSSDANAIERQRRSRASIDKAITELKSFIQAQAERDALKGASSTQTDPVLLELDGLLRGRIGNPFSDEALKAAILEAEARAARHIPPGYEDFKDKPARQAAGDYLVWAQLLDEAEKRRSDVLLVTGDVKADWWHPGSNHAPARPRPELTVELRKRAGTQLYMITPSQLLARANEIFDMRVDKRSVSDLQTTENERNNHPRFYNRAIESILRQHFPEAQILSRDQQIHMGSRTPIPDITFVHPRIKIGLEVKRYIENVEDDDIQYLPEMIEKHDLQAVLIVSNTPLSPAALQYLTDSARESKTLASWIRVRESNVDTFESQENLKMQIRQLIEMSPKVPQ